MYASHLRLRRQKKQKLWEILGLPMEKVYRTLTKNSLRWIKQLLPRGRAILDADCQEEVAQGKGYPQGSLAGSIGIAGLTTRTGRIEKFMMSH